VYADSDSAPASPWLLFAMLAVWAGLALLAARHAVLRVAD
jgi:hypothetical protein